MNWAVKQRVFYLLLVVAFFAVIAGGFWYQIRPAPSCQDGKQNQSEIGVDCGGPCARVCSFEVKPAKEVWSRVFKIDDSRYDAVTFLKNPNRNLAARQLGYRIKIFDAQDVLITTKTGEAFLNPNESFFVYNSRLDVGNREPKRASFEITDGPVWQRVEAKLPIPKVTYKNFVNQPTPLLVAQVANDSLQTITDLQIVAVLSDEDQNALAVSSTLVEKLEQGESREVAFTWPKALSVDPTFFNFYPHLDLAKVK